MVKPGAEADARQVARALRATETPVLVIDTGNRPSAPAREIAEAMGAAYDLIVVPAWRWANQKAANLGDGQCGLTDGSSAGDWRLPNVKELQSLLDFGNYSPALPNDYQGGAVEWSYWSSTTHQFSTSSAFYVVMGMGHVGVHDKTSNFHAVWPVRSDN